MLVVDVKVGQFVEIEDRHTGLMFGMMVGEKSGHGVKLSFDIPSNVIVRVLDYRPAVFGLGKRHGGANAAVLQDG